MHKNEENPTKYKTYCFGKYEEKSVFCKDRCRYKNQCKKEKEFLKLSSKGMVGELADVKMYKPSKPLSKKYNG